MLSQIAKEGGCGPCANAIEDYGFQGATNHYFAARTVLMTSDPNFLPGINCPEAHLTAMPDASRQEAATQILNLMLDRQVSTGGAQ